MEQGSFKTQELHNLTANCGKHLDLSRKTLTEIPHILCTSCTQLQFLYLEGNSLQLLPDNFFPSLPNLKWLDARNNILKEIPVSIEQHPKLEILLLQANCIRQLPLELGMVPNLRGIQLLGNPVEFPPPNIVSKGVDSILQFLREEWNIKSNVNIRPIEEPFYQRPQKKGGASARKNLSHSSLCHPAVIPRRALNRRGQSAELPPISVHSYKCISPSETQRPEPHAPAPPSGPDGGDVGIEQKIFQLWPPQVQATDHREIERDRVQEMLLREMCIARIKEMLEKQAAIIQRRKDKMALRRWQHEAQCMKNKKDSRGAADFTPTFPYDVDPGYATMLQRAEIQNPNSARDKVRHKANKYTCKSVDAEMAEVFDTLQQMQRSKQQQQLSPHAEQMTLAAQIAKLNEIQKRLQTLKHKSFYQGLSKSAKI